MNPENKLIFIVGISIPSLAAIGFCVLFFYINQSYYYNLDSVSLASMNISGAIGRKWVIYVCYALPGLLITLFTLLCLRQSKKGGIERIAFPIICISGLSWASLSINPMHTPADNLSFVILLSKIFLTLGLGTLGFLLLVIRHKELKLTSPQKFAILLLCGAIVIESGIHLFGNTNVSVFSIISYVSYFMIFAVLALHYKNKQITKVDKAILIQ